MADESFRVVFRGEIAAGESATDVRERLAQRLRLTPERIERLFSGRPVVVKRGMEQGAAEKIRAAFRQAGAICEVEAEASTQAPSEDPPVTPPRHTSEARPAHTAPEPENVREEAETSRAAGTAADPAPSEPVAAGSEAPGDDPNRTIIPLAIPDDVGDLEIDRGDAYVSPPDDTPPPQIDTSGLDIDDSPDPLEAPDTTTRPPEIDTSQLELAPLDAHGRPR